MMIEHKTSCPVCGALKGTMCATAGRVGAERFAPHAGRAFTASLMSAGLSEAAAIKAVRS